MLRCTSVVVLCTLISGCSSDALNERPLPPPTEAVEVTIKREIELTSRARIPERDAAFESAVASADRVVLNFKSKPSIQIAAGDVVAGTGATPYLRKVVEVASRTDRQIELLTEPAELTDLIVDGAFALKIAPDAATWDTEASPEISGHQYALSTELDLFGFMDSGDGLSCKPGLSIKPILKPDFSFLVEVDIEPTFFPLGGELKYAKFAVDGRVQVGGGLDIDVGANITCTLDLIAYLRSTRTENFLRLKSSIATAIGPVPVQVTLLLDPVFKVDGQVEVTAKTKVGAVATVNLGVVAGVEYVDEQTNAIWQPTATGSTQATFPELSGFELSGSAKLSAGIKAAALLYDTAGPQVGIVGFLEDKITASTETCKWVATATAGIEASVGLKAQVPLIAKELFSVSESFELAKKQIAKIEGELPLCTLDAGPEAGLDGGVDLGDATVDGPPGDVATDLPSPDGPTDMPVADSALVDAITHDYGTLDVGGSGCASGSAVEDRGNLVFCADADGKDQCGASSLCAPGWHLCTASEYLARGGATDYAPVSGTYWLASCIRDGGAVHAPTDATCSCGALADGAQETFTWDCDSGSTKAFGVQSRVGLHAHRSYNQRAGVNDAKWCAYWVPAVNTVLLGGAVCCR